MAPPHVFTIPPGVPFLDTLVGALLDGRLVPGFEPRDPFALADVKLYLPTRRAARAIRESFLARFERPVLLPDIRTLGDIDEDEAGLIEGALPDLPPAVPALERQLVLTELVLGWSGALVRAAAGLPDEELIVPASPADAARLAASLGQLIDHVGTERDAWQGLFRGLEGDLARYWEITLEFLRIATEFWPKHLAERGMIDPGARRDRLIRAEAERLVREGSSAPVIAAGSTGSVPATRTLLAAIASLSNGAVVLPGLDQGIDKEGWAAVGSDGDPAGAGHPQYGLKLLLGSLGLTRDAVRPLAVSAPPLVVRGRFVSESMRPAVTTERWTSAPALGEEEKAEALAGFALVEARNEREEALAGAVLLRQAVEEGKVAAMVTPDRGLARRVAVEMRRWGIDVDDSAGQPLGLTPPGTLARLVAEVGFGSAAAEPLLALLKHPLATFGMTPFLARQGARAMERLVLRGPRLRPGLAALRHAVAAAIAAREQAGPRRTTEAAWRLSPAARIAAGNIADRIGEALAGLERLAEREAPAPLADLLDAHFEALAAAARGKRRRTTLFAGEAGEALALAFETLRESAGYFQGGIRPSDYPALFSALIESTAIRRRGGFDPRVHIWGTLEARLQSVDRVILCGLNEGTWPTQTRLDPLLSRPMRAALDLDPPERRIGLAGHDFTQALGHADVWVTRAARQDGEPRVASRWLQRLLAYAGEKHAALIRGRGNVVLAFARALDAPESFGRAERPNPSPPLELRPKQLSVTRIETLLRDPYAIYAREVLRLRPFEPIAKLPDAAERGMLIHTVLDRFVRERPAGPFDDAALARLLAIGREEFAKHTDFPDVIALWWPRFERIARWFVRTEAERPEVANRHIEGSGRLQVTSDFVLTARADRIDRLADGTLAILDYKTGAPPSMDEVVTLSPQLPLEGVMARRGAFEGVAAGETSALLYYRLSGRGEGGELADRSFCRGSKTRPEVALPEILATTERRLGEIVEDYARPETGYLSRKIPKRGRVYVGDYDHLARVAEWTASEEELDE